MKNLYLGASAKKITGKTFIIFQENGFIFRVRCFKKMEFQIRFIEKDSGTFFRLLFRIISQTEADRYMWL